MAEETPSDVPVGQADQGAADEPRGVSERAVPIARQSEQQPRVAPRSPRARLEPERMAPAKFAKRARHPVVVIGNAILTLILVVALGVGVTLAIGKQRFEAPGPLESDKVVNIPRGSGVRDIADILQR